MRYSRRLVLIAAAARAVLLPRAVDLAWPEVWTSAALGRLRGLLRCDDSARAVAAAYARAFPAEAEPATVAGLLLSSLSCDGRRLVLLSRAALRTLVIARSRADFAAGNTAEIDGWILSRTEARLCALWLERGEG